MNVKFYRLLSLPTFASANHTGIFVHLTADQTDGQTVLHKAGLYFGGTSNWEYLTNDTDVANIQSMIDTTIAGLDVAGYAQGSIAAASGENPTSSELKIFGIKEVDGKISHDTTTDLTINVAGVYNASSNKIATQSTVTNALGILNGSHNVITISNAESGVTTYAKKVEFFDGTQTNGALGTSSVTDTLYLSQAVTTTNPIITKGDLSGIVGAMVYKGAVNSNSDLPSSDVQAGWTYVVATAGTYAGQDCEVGDMIIAKDSTPTWNVINGENQVTNAGATITAGAGSATTIATVDGTAITAQVSVTAGSATIASKSGDIVTLKTGVTQGTNTGTIANDSRTDITLAAVASTGVATDLAVTSANYGGSTAVTDAQSALNNLASAISSTSITIDGQVGAIITGNGIATLTDNIKVIQLDLDNTNANGLYLSGETNGQKKLAMAKATGSSFGAVEVTAGNGLTLTNGVVAYAHNTSAITVASNNGGVVTINGTLTPDASDAITTSNAITLSKVATTGAAADVSYAGTDSVTGSEPATVEDALDDLYSKVSAVSGAHTTLTATQNNSVSLTSTTNAGGGTNYDIDLVWQESLA